MYRKPRFLKVLHAIREQMSREVDYDVDLFVEMIRATRHPSTIDTVRVYRNRKGRAAAADAIAAADNQGKRRRRAAK